MGSSGVKAARRMLMKLTQGGCEEKNQYNENLNSNNLDNEILDYKNLINDNLN